ncbi:hypothetical protein ACFU99_01710 [Streptomyces sp. NPDC057654]|uniref:hypothetical protein n=1 Tax=Streptomyces sp. NPDC057654 TaxID=3346196 RepID=UPI0036771C52
MYRQSVREELGLKPDGLDRYVLALQKAELDFVQSVTNVVEESAVEVTALRMAPGDPADGQSPPAM